MAVFQIRFWILLSAIFAISRSAQPYGIWLIIRFRAIFHIIRLSLLWVALKNARGSITVKFQASSKTRKGHMFCSCPSRAEISLISRRDRFTGVRITFVSPNFFTSVHPTSLSSWKNISNIPSAGILRKFQNLSIALLRSCTFSGDNRA